MSKESTIALINHRQERLNGCLVFVPFRAWVVQTFRIGDPRSSRPSHTDCV
jgi:hypothetical protein